MLKAQQIAQQRSFHGAFARNGLIHCQWVAGDVPDVCCCVPQRPVAFEHCKYAFCARGTRATRSMLRNAKLIRFMYLKYAFVMATSQEVLRPDHPVVGQVPFQVVPLEKLAFDVS